VTKTPEDQITAWLDVFDAPDACAAHLLCDDHDPDAVAFTFVDGDLGRLDLSYGELSERSRRFASVLAEEGVGRGDRVGVLMGKRIELVVALLAIWRLGAVHVPLFTAFATPAIQMRLAASAAGVVVTEPDQEPKVRELAGVTRLVAGAELAARVAAAQPLEAAVAVGGAGELVRIFTSGTTGAPKAVPVPLRALAAFSSYMIHGLDVREDDVFWNAADPGWAYGLYYGILGPLAIGRPNLLLGAGFSAELTVAVIRRLGVTNLASAPTVYRVLRTSGAVRGLSLRRASSAGEPLTPDVVSWAVDALGVQVRDHYGQTELGMVVANAWHPEVARPVRDGSMGFALPGFSAEVVDGGLALDVPGSPLMWFDGYVGAPDKTAERFVDSGDRYLTGDLASADEDGYVFFTSRDDDLILMAGYRIGPFDVESVLITHPRVADVAVVGRPDQLRGEVVEAFVVLRKGFEPSEGLVSELQDLVREGYSAHAYPRRVHFVDALPKTPSGKVQRYVLRRAEQPL
jgi:acetyl-CoA synthetase